MKGKEIAVLTVEIHTYIPTEYLKSPVEVVF
jgi:hypothetical protein